MFLFGLGVFERGEGCEVAVLNIQRRVSHGVADRRWKTPPLLSPTVPWALLLPSVGGGEDDPNLRGTGVVNRYMRHRPYARDT